MPAQPHRTRTLRRVYVKTPGGKLKIDYRKRKPGKAKCAACKKPLLGAPRERPYKIRTMAKTKRRPTRPYGGYLCSSCTRKKIIGDVRGEK